VTQGAALTVVGASDNLQRLALQDAGVQTLLMPDPAGKVDLAAVVRALGKQQCNEVHVEAGAALSVRW
jgi:diaminohydroxyphosphoribosylaminopyrimidine deaminase/5-amino-6-(5-phosphoribosylamino)uracil reductase